LFRKFPLLRRMWGGSSQGPPSLLPPAHDTLWFSCLHPLVGPKKEFGLVYLILSSQVARVVPIFSSSQFTSLSMVRFNDQALVTFRPLIQADCHTASCCFARYVSCVPPPPSAAHPPPALVPPPPAPPPPPSPPLPPPLDSPLCPPPQLVPM